jgi:hypothetical protein
VNRSRYNKLADAAYERVAEAKDKFDIDDVIAEIVAELSAEQASAELIREFAQTLAAKTDDKHAARAESNQMDLLAGVDEAMDVVWRLGDGTRVKARKARRREVLKRLELRRENFERVSEAFEADRQITAELLVYMPDEVVTVEDAVQARKKAQP